MTDTPKLYCGTYGKYNNGSIAGKWLDLTDYEDAEEFFKACAELHKGEYDPEFMFQDYENFPESMYSECMGKEAINAIIEYGKLDERQKQMAEAYCEATGNKFEDIETVEEAFLFEAEGNFTPIEEQYGYYMVESGCIEIPENLSNYFDYRAYGRDMMDNTAEANGFIFDRTT